MCRLQRLNSADIEDVREEIRRLAARLRTRAALRQKRAKSGRFDPRKTIRKNMRYGGVPMEVQFRKRHKKPTLILICDLSTSMRYAVEFLLTMVYELSDQVRRTHSFIFIHDLVDVSTTLTELPPREAVARIMAENPPGYYSTDLGNGLNSFGNDHMPLDRQPLDHPVLRRRAQQLQRSAPRYRAGYAAQRTATDLVLPRAAPTVGQRRQRHVGVQHVRR